MKIVDNSVIGTTIKHFNSLQAFMNKMDYFEAIVVILFKLVIKFYRYK